MLLCRSGVRSVAAAKRATELGLPGHNILEGFEGDPMPRPTARATKGAGVFMVCPAAELRQGPPRAPSMRSPAARVAAALINNAAP